MKSKTIRRMLASLLAMACVTGTLVGCGSNTSKESSNKGSSEEVKSSAVESQTQESAAQSEQDTSEIKVTYPIEGDVTLTVAVLDEANVTTYYEDLFATPYGQAWQEATGVTVECEVYADMTAMNLMFASGDLPDIVILNGDEYNGGMEGMVADGIAQPLNDYMQYAPDLQAVFDSDETAKYGTMTSDGSIYGFPLYRIEDDAHTYYGTIIRKDFLDQVGMDVPETADEFYEVLKAFKEKLNIEAPFSMKSGDFIYQALGMGIWTSAFDLPRAALYVEDGIVHYGYSEDEYKDVLAYIHKLYDEKLLDPNFSVIDSATRRANFMNGVSGVCMDTISGGMGTFLTTMADDPTFDCVGVGPLVAKEGDTAMCTQWDDTVSLVKVGIVTTDCKNKEAAVQFMNYGYTEDGYMLNNFGVEGESYEIVDGKVTFTDLIYNNPEGKTVAQAQAAYTRSWNAGPFVMSSDVLPLLNYRPQQVEALQTWSKSNAKDYAMPPVDVAPEDADEYSKIMADVDTYVKEMTLLYITGEKDLATFESEYQATLKEMGLETALEMMQEAYTAYVSR